MVKHLPDTTLDDPKPSPFALIAAEWSSDNDSFENEAKAEEVELETVDENPLEIVQVDFCPSFSNTGDPDSVSQQHGLVGTAHLTDGTKKPCIAYVSINYSPTKLENFQIKMNAIAKNNPSINIKGNPFNFVQFDNYMHASITAKQFSRALETATPSDNLASESWKQIGADEQIPAVARFVVSSSVGIPGKEEKITKVTQFIGIGNVISTDDEGNSVDIYATVQYGAYHGTTSETNLHAIKDKQIAVFCGIDKKQAYNVLKDDQTHIFTGEAVQKYFAALNIPLRTDNITSSVTNRVFAPHISVVNLGELESEVEAVPNEKYSSFTMAARVLKVNQHPPYLVQTCAENTVGSNTCGQRATYLKAEKKFECKSKYGHQHGDSEMKHQLGQTTTILETQDGEYFVVRDKYGGFNNLLQLHNTDTHTYYESESAKNTPYANIPKKVSDRVIRKLEGKICILDLVVTQNNGQTQIGALWMIPVPWKTFPPADRLKELLDEWQWKNYMHIQSRYSNFPYAKLQSEEQAQRMITNVLRSERTYTN